ETAHPAPEHHEGDPAQAVPAHDDAMEDGHSGDDRDNIVQEMEEEERVREGDDDGSAKVRRPAWINPYE
ncbi:hypothetical protein A2U01_0089919, partial [Trifolium medium]|nr:hypothetical protein [Trifolium medium]